MMLKKKAAEATGVSTGAEMMWITEGDEEEVPFPKLCLHPD